VRPTLISAIAACAEERVQKRARRFLEGLSTDELQYIAEFLGGCVLDPFGHDSINGAPPCSHAAAPPAPGLSDREHKMILLREYLWRCRPMPRAAAAPGERSL